MLENLINYICICALLAITIVVGYVFFKKPDFPFKTIFGLLVLLIILFSISNISHTYSETIYDYIRIASSIILIIIVAYFIYNINEILLIKTPKQLEKSAKDIDNILLSAREREALFRTLVNNNPDMISLINTNLEIEFVNDAICKYSNMPREFFIGKRAEELGTNQPGEIEYYENIRRSLGTGDIINYESTGWYDPSLFFQHTIVPLKDAKNETNSVLSIIKDITSQKQIEKSQKKIIHELEVISEQLLYQNMQLQDFANITSHNLRSPVTNINSLVEMFEKESNVEMKQEIFDKIKTVSLRLSVTVNDLIETIKLKKNFKKELEVVFFEQQLLHVMSSIQAEIADKNASVSYKFEMDKINYPKIYLESIFLNLLTNALKYKHPDRNPEIVFETYKSGNYVVLTCKDNGLGMDLKKNGKKLFGLNNTFHTNKDAKGIGLYITKNQIESMGGSITAKSELGVGTTFQISFVAK